MATVNSSLIEVGKRQLSRITHRLHSLPIVVLMPHSRCNCRCVMCDIWKANGEKRELSRADLAQHVESLRRLNVRHVVLSGGEALMHTNLWTLCELLKELRIRITLLSTGLLMRWHAAAIVQWTDEVIVSLDGSQPIHDRIRNIPNAYQRLSDGVAALKACDRGFQVTARSTLQQHNFADLPNIVRSAHEMHLDGISFLAADVSSQAFNHTRPWDDERMASVALSMDEVRAFAEVVEELVVNAAEDFASGFIAESPAKLRRLVQYFGALNGLTDFPANRCNAPWVSAVVEADGSVRPCFFHPSFGNIHRDSLQSILNSDQAIAFRRNLDVGTDPICKKCVCTLNLPLRATFTSRDVRGPAATHDPFETGHDGDEDER